MGGKGKRIEKYKLSVIHIELGDVKYSIGNTVSNTVKAM